MDSKTHPDKDGFYGGTSRGWRDTGTRICARLPVAMLCLITAPDRRLLLRDSYLALTHVTADHVPASATATAQEVYAGASAPVTPRSRAKVTRLFDGMTLVEPGVTDVRAWHPEIPPARPQSQAPARGTHLYGAVALKPCKAPR